MASACGSLASRLGDATARTGAQVFENWIGYKRRYFRSRMSAAPLKHLTRPRRADGQTVISALS